jgi:hypothetical protein
MLSRVASVTCGWDASKGPRIVVERFVIPRNLRLQSTFHKGPSSSTSRSTSTTVEQDLLEVKKGRPQTTWERIRNFPKGTKMLYLDCLRYISIHDASRTPLNAWTINHPHHPPKRKKDGAREFILYDNERRPGRIPRRQYEQQRRLRNDIRTMAPLTAICTMPFIGSIPMVLVIAVPRQILSHHFHNDYEYAMYARTEYRQRRSVYMEIGDYFWSTMLINIHKTCLEESQQDTAGPIFDGMIIYSAFTEDPNIVSSSMIPNLRMQQGSLSSINALSREYLVSAFSLKCFGYLWLDILLWTTTRPIECGNAKYHCRRRPQLFVSFFRAFFVLTGQVFSSNRHQPVSSGLGKFMGRKSEPIVVATT